MIRQRKQMLLVASLLVLLRGGALVEGALQALAASVVEFVDITRASGIDFEHKSSATPNKYLLETMGGGVALLDYDNDGRLDVFLTNGAKIDETMPEGKLPDKSDPPFGTGCISRPAAARFAMSRRKRA